MKNNTNFDYFNPISFIEQKIKENGGWSNCHAHIDRAYTVTRKNFHLYSASIQEKWDLNDGIKKTSTVDDYYDRMAYAIENMIAQGVTAICSFIDVDEVVKDKAIKAAIKLREMYKSDITIKYINQVHKGVLDPKAREWFDIGAEFVDIIGGLPNKDKPHQDKHIDIILLTAKKMGKMVHAHVDQLNLPEETETELLVDKTIEHGMEGKVVGVHGISIGAHPKEYRTQLYEKMKKAKFMMVCCPIAFLDCSRTEQMMPFHNSILPVDEMIPHGITVALGTDNIHDIYVPFNEGKMRIELQALIAACRYTNIEELAKIATINGRKVMGLN